MKIHVVIGSGFGDEGKGRTTNFLAKQGKNPIVVRFNGGHQAGHTVVEDGVRHVFSTFGSGTLVNAPTFISKYCTIYPTSMLREYEVLREKDVKPVLFIDPMAMVTTPYDVADNRREEIANAHGSCGSGFGKTVERHETIAHSHRIFAKDLTCEWILRQKLENLANMYCSYLVDVDLFVRDCLKVANLFKIQSQDKTLTNGYETFIFEGAQGVLLDREHGLYPNVTRSHTTSKNFWDIIKPYSVLPSDIEMHYLSRCYQTRHGNGALFGEGHKVNLVNNQVETNVFNLYQGDFRTAPLSMSLLKYAVTSDLCYHPIKVKSNLILSHLDQIEGLIPIIRDDGNVENKTKASLMYELQDLLEMNIIPHNKETA